MKKLLVAILALAFLIHPAALAAPQTIDLETMTLDELTSHKEAVDAAIEALMPDPVYEDIIDEEDATRDNPAPIGATVLYSGNSYYNEAETEITVTKVVRGDAATSIVRGWNRYNDKPSKGNEYVIAYVKTKAVDADSSKPAELSDYYFTFVSSSGVEYNDPYIADVSPKLQNVYPGSENEGALVTLVPIGDKPMLVYLKNYDSPMWFDLNTRKPIVLDESVVLTPLKKGDKGDEVQNMQAMLAEMGFLKTTPDGDYGNKTVEAVKAYQKAMGLEQTGIADEATLRMILTAQMP